MKLIYKALIPIVVIFLVSSTALASESCCGKVCFPQRVQVPDQAELIFRSCAEYSYFWFDLYTAASYTQESCEKGELSSACSRQLVLHYKRDLSVQNFIDGANSVIDRAKPKISPELKASVEKFHSFYRPVSEKDRYTMRYVPGEGTSLILNDKTLGVVEGTDFFKLYFGIWLGPDPLSKSNRDELFNY